MEPEVFEAWSPVEEVPRILYVEAMHDDYEGLRVLLRGRGDPDAPLLRLIFESVVGYRNVNESYRLATWAAHDMTQHPTLLIVKHSKWIEQLRIDAGGVLDDEELTHYAIYSPEDCIDVVSAFPPDVHWLNH